MARALLKPKLLSPVYPQGLTKPACYLVRITTGHQEDVMVDNLGVWVSLQGANKGAFFAEIARDGTTGVIKDYVSQHNS